MYKKLLEKLDSYYTFAITEYIEKFLIKSILIIVIL